METAEDSYFFFVEATPYPDKQKVIVDYSKNKSIRHTVMTLMERENEKYIISKNKEWEVDYIATIPLNKKDMSEIGQSVVEYILSEMKKR